MSPEKAIYNIEDLLKKYANDEFGIYTNKETERQYIIEYLRKDGYLWHRGSDGEDNPGRWPAKDYPTTKIYPQDKRIVGGTTKNLYRFNDVSFDSKKIKLKRPENEADLLGMIF